MIDYIKIINENRIQNILCVKTMTIRIIHNLLSQKYFINFMFCYHICLLCATSNI